MHKNEMCAWMYISKCVPFQNFVFNVTVDNYVFQNAISFHNYLFIAIL